MEFKGKVQDAFELVVAAVLGNQLIMPELEKKEEQFKATTAAKIAELDGIDTALKAMPDGPMKKDMSSYAAAQRKALDEALILAKNETVRAYVGDIMASLAEGAAAAVPGAVVVSKVKPGAFPHELSFVNQYSTSAEYTAKIGSNRSIILAVRPAFTEAVWEALGMPQGDNISIFSFTKGTAAWNPRFEGSFSAETPSEACAQFGVWLGAILSTKAHRSGIHSTTWEGSKGGVNAKFRDEVINMADMLISAKATPSADVPPAAPTEEVQPVEEPTEEVQPVEEPTAEPTAA